MELTNTLSIPAELTISDFATEDDGSPIRLGSLTAKATFDVGQGGRLELADDPAPILRMEETVELGVLPRDVVPPRPPGLDLMILGAAHAPRGRPVREMYVTLLLGEHRWDLAVTGDRLWVQQENDWLLGPPAEFLRMPLSWSRTFGGTAEVWLDDSSPIDICDHLHPMGRGFDPGPKMNGVKRSLECPAGFPRLAYKRLAPNIEHPSFRVTASGDRPEPHCWAPLPIDMGLRGKWAAEAIDSNMLQVSSEETGVNRVQDTLPRQGLWFGHRDLRIPVPPPQTPVEIIGCTPSGRWRFGWPGLQLVGDYILGERRGERRLQPQMAVLFPEEERLVLTYRAWFRFQVDDEQAERSIRLRAVK